MYRKPVLLLLVTIMMSITFQSSARAGLSNELSECAAIIPDNMRMKCYDDLAITGVGSIGAVEDTGLEKEAAPTLRVTIKNRLEKYDRMKAFKMAPYRPSYVLPVSYNKSRNSKPWQALEPGIELDDTEVKFQLSMQYKLADDLFWGNGDFWFGYTQLAFWQLYNSDTSSPFRDTNYEPEGFFTFRTNWNILGLTNNAVTVGFNHQSNGRAEPLSRSWNRVYAEFFLQRGNFTMILKPWYWFDEDEDDLDNPNMDGYIGHGQINFLYAFKNVLLNAKWRNNFDFRSEEDNHGSIQLDIAFPLYHGLKGYVQYFSGYGESLVDYNVTSETIGLGIIMANWM